MRTTTIFRSRALSGCQLVEQQLKLHITETLERVRKCVGDKMPFNISGQDCANSSSGIEALPVAEDAMHAVSLWRSRA